MPLLPNSRLGGYEIVSLLGAGGMGEVYRATDTNLKRQVALKVLPASVAADADRLARFQREAEVLAALNHPYIAQIYGIERSAGATALVMELVEGDDLSQRIARGPIPLDEALPIARQIAEALEAAHEQGIVHRDLKPANIKVRPDGTVKVLDFGLAKAMEPGGAARGSGAAPTLAHAPTITSPAMTEAGVILGTAAYMAPEQARGRASDRRVDLWAFGCVLFEMLTGRRAFEGDSFADVLGAVVRADPDWARLPADTPAHVRRVLERCLRKDSAQRLAHASAARQDLEEGEVGTGPAALAAPVPAPSPRLSPWMAVAAVAAVALISGLAVVAMLRASGTAPATASAPGTLRLAIVAPPEQPLNAGSALAMSPDGTFVVYTTLVDGQPQLTVRHLDRLNPVPLAGTANVTGAAAISPDGKWVAFAAGAFLKKVPVAGGSEITLCRYPGVLIGMSWGADDRILFASPNMSGSLFSVPAAGGTPVAVSTPDGSTGETRHTSPFVLPGGRAALFTVRRGTAASAQVALLDLESGAHRVLLPSADSPTFIEPGYVVYRSGSSLWAVPFDPGRGELSGDAFTIAPDVGSGGFAARYAASAKGALAYIPGAARTAATRDIVWVDRRGREERLPVPPHPYQYGRLSPDQTRIAVPHSNDIWLWSLAGSHFTRLTVDESADYPVWAADGSRVIYASDRSGVSVLWRRRADGSGEAERLTNSSRPQLPLAATPDGRHVLVRETTDSGNHLVLAALDGTSPPVTLLPLPFGENSADVSPDGRWLAYQQNTAGGSEIFVQPLPDVAGGRWQVSNGGGAKPRFSPDGTELLFMSYAAKALMRVPLPSGRLFSASSPVVAMPGLNRFFNTIPLRPWDVSRDGRFLMVKDLDDGTAAAARNIVVVTNFLADTGAARP